MENNILKIYTKKSNFWMRMAFFIFVAIIFLPINIIVRIPLSVVLFLTVAFISITKLKAKYIMPVINEQLDTKLFKDLIYSTNNHNKYALEEVLTAYLDGDYNRVVNICNTKLADKKCVAHKLNYLQYLGRVYFDLGNLEKLQEICNEFEEVVSKKKNSDKLRNYYKLTKYFEAFLDGNFEDCYEMYNQLYNDANYCKTRLTKVQIGYSYAVACYKTERIDEAKEIFSFVADAGAKTNYGSMARKYLSAISGDHDYKYDKLEITVEEKFDIEAPAKPKMKKGHMITVFACLAFLFVMATVVSIKGMPKAPQNAIASQAEIDQAVEVFHLNEAEDALCLYKDKIGAYCVAYLDNVKNGKYVCKITETAISEEYQYSISAPDSDLTVHYSVYRNKEEVPEDAYAVFVYPEGEKYYFCIEMVEENDVLFYSRTKLLKEIYD